MPQKQRIAIVIGAEPNRHGTGTNMVVTILACVEELAMELDLKKINGARFPVVLLTAYSASFAKTMQSEWFIPLMDVVDVISFTFTASNQVVVGGEVEVDLGSTVHYVALSLPSVCFVLLNK